MQPNTQKCTVLPVSDGIQGVMGKQEVGSGEEACQSYGVFKKMTDWSGWDDQIRVFLHPQCQNLHYSFHYYRNMQTF